MPPRKEGLLPAPERVEVIVRDLSNEQMLKMMARENMEEWGTSAWVELETVRAVLEAYSKGEIELPKVPQNAPKSDIRELRHGSGVVTYTKVTVASFIGRTRKNRDGVRPSDHCETAFKAIDMIDSGFLEVADLKDLTRGQLSVLVTEQWSIYQAEMRAAKREEEEAEKARKNAEKAALEAAKAKEAATKAALEDRLKRWQAQSLPPGVRPSLDRTYLRA